MYLKPPDRRKMTTVYVQPACVQCNATKRFLDKHDIDYETIDISEDPQSLELIVGMGFTAAPVVITDDDSWSGFQPDKLENLK